MDMKSTIMAALLALLGGTGGAAIVNSIHDRWKFKATREAQKEDKAEEQADKTESLEDEVSQMKETERKISEKHDKDMKSLTDQMDAQSEALRLILLDRILSMGKDLVEQKEITFEDRKRFRAMHNCYHTSLGGNGDADVIVKAVDELPLKM